jgi:hypothetical protein
MALQRFELRVETGSTSADRLKLVWTGYGPGDDAWTPSPYEVSKGKLIQAAEQVRINLRQLAESPEPLPKDQYQKLLRRLAQRGAELHQNLFSVEDGDGGSAIDAKRYMEEARRAGFLDDRSVPVLSIIICDDTALLPWGFVFCGDNDEIPSPPSLSISDARDFWLSSFRLTTRVTGGRRLPNPRKPTSRTVLALHEELFSCARRDLERSEELACRLDDLLSESGAAATKWSECRALWKDIREDHDSILYLFGHSDGQRILLKDGVCDGDPDFEMPVSSFEYTFQKDLDTRSASIVLLNGCRTAAPQPLSGSAPVSANFLTATRRPGFHGFIGTEAEVPSAFASRYGVAFLWQLCREGKSVGEAFDALRREPTLFPLSLLYTCFADRDFRLAVMRQAGRASASAGGKA